MNKGQKHTELRVHSSVAWRIASRYGHILASETRDLAGHIDTALNRERENIRELAEALESHERLYQDGILNTTLDDYEKVHIQRRAALSKLKGSS